MEPTPYAAQIASARAMIWLGTLPPHHPPSASLGAQPAHRDAPGRAPTGAPVGSWRRHDRPEHAGQSAPETRGPRTEGVLVALWRRVTERRPGTPGAPVGSSGRDPVPTVAAGR